MSVPARACELCASVAAPEPLYPAKRIVRCSSCGLVYHELPPGFDPSAPYDDAYFNGGEYLGYERDKAALQLNFSARVRDLRAMAPDGGDLLEIGSAYGFFLDLARAHWRARGLEISPGAATCAREALGVDVRVADFLALPDEPESVDLVCLWDTIEHLPHPVRVVEKAARWLRPGGHLVMTTGDLGSTLARWRGESWRQIHPPTHLFYFTRATLRRAVEQAGLEVFEERSVAHTRDIFSMLHGLALRWRLPWPAAAPAGLSLPITLDLGDILLLVARKSGKLA